MVKRLFLKKGGGVIVISKSILITCYLLQSIKCKPQEMIKRKDGRGGTRSEGAGARGRMQGGMSNGGTAKGMKIKVQRTKCNG